MEVEFTRFTTCLVFEHLESTPTIPLNHGISWQSGPRAVDVLQAALLALVDVLQDEPSWG